MKSGKNVTLSGDALDAYYDFVNTYKMLNRTGIVKNKLSEIFREATKKLQLQHQYVLSSSCMHTHQSGLHSDMSLLEAEAIDLIKEKWLNHLTPVAKKNWKLEVWKVEQVVEQIFKIRNWRTVARYKKQILYRLQLDQIRIKGREYIVLKYDFDKDKAQKQLSKANNEPKIQELINEILRGAKKYEMVVISQLGGVDNFKIFKEKCETYGIKEVFDGDDNYFILAENNFNKNVISEALQNGD